jgi:hypothetical protein
MRTLGLAIAAGALLVATQANAGNFPVNTLAGTSGDLVDRVAVRVYVHEGRRYCFYFDGWHGPGWYRCGFAFRRGLGWGGVYGWNDWSYGPYERRFGGRHRGERIGVEGGSRRERIGVESGSRRIDSGVETRTRGRTSSGAETRSRSMTTGSGVEGGARVRGGTTGKAPNADVQTEGGAKVQGGGSVGEGAGMRGGGNMGGGSSGGEGNSRR